MVQRRNRVYGNASQTPLGLRCFLLGRKPGRGTVSARFHLTDQMLTDIHTHTAHGDKYLPELSVDITNNDGDLVARGFKTLHIRRKHVSKDAVSCA
jgi:hypothetical protein